MNGTRIHNDLGESAPLRQFQHKAKGTKADANDVDEERMLPHAAKHVQFFARFAVMPQGVCFVALNVELDGDGLSSAFTTKNLRERRQHQQAVRRNTIGGNLFSP